MTFNVTTPVLGLATWFALSVNAFAITTFETTFGGFPVNTSQHGLRELSPALFADEGLPRETGCLAAALYFEARGESRTGQIAVAQVIVNRMRSGAYPDSICDVVWQNSHKRNRCQFSFTCDGRMDLIRDRKTWLRTKRLAETFMGRRSYKAIPHAMHPIEILDAKTRRSTHYHATYVTPPLEPKA